MNKELLTELEVGQRLDKVLSAAYEQYSRSSLEKLILKGEVLVNDVQRPASYRIKEGDKVSVDLSEFKRPVTDHNLPIIYEDENVVVINKPAGVLTHAKGTLHNEPTVATWLKGHTSRTDLDEEFWSSNRAGIVHRLDRGTSGVIICAKNEAAQKYLQKQFADRKAKKSYIAVVSGHLPEQKGVIDVPIERNPKKPATFRPGINGKSAQTEFSMLKTKNDLSLVELKPLTGRTHQLRVHLNYLKCPIVGDEVYGGIGANRMMLHAQKLEITLPGGGQRHTFESKTPQEFAI
jgi:23S rRNA pseudouridine1911/1915/1917 synthase